MTHRVLRGDIAGVALFAPVLLEGLRLPLSFNASFHDGVVYDESGNTIMTGRCVGSRESSEAMHVLNPLTLLPFAPVARGACTREGYRRALCEGIDALFAPQRRRVTDANDSDGICFLVTARR